MKQAHLCLLSALTITAACGGSSRLDAFEDGVPAYLLGARPGRPGGGAEDGGAGDASAPDGSPSDASAPDAGGQAQGAVGDPCETADDCRGEAPSCLQSVDFAGGAVQIEFAGGYCTETGCEDDDDCPGGSACYDGAGTTGCNKLCESDSDCRQAEGYSCATIPLSGDPRTFCQPEFSFGGLF